MIKLYSRFISVVLFILGLWGFWIGSIPQFVQFDLWQSFIYLILGGVGLQLSFGKHEFKYLVDYLKTVGIVSLIFILFGLSFPNFFDIFHFEVPEHVWHFVLGVASLLVIRKYN